MDKELIRMCDCPEIQDRWDPKVGDRVTDHEYRETLHIENINPLSGRAQVVDNGGIEDNVHPSNLIYIPRIEDVLEWLGKFNIQIVSPTTDRPNKGWTFYCENGNEEYHGNTLIQAFVSAFMGESHNKTWNGEAWV